MFLSSLYILVLCSRCRFMFEDVFELLKLISCGDLMYMLCGRGFGVIVRFFLYGGKIRLLGILIRCRVLMCFGVVLVK